MKVTYKRPGKEPLVFNFRKVVKTPYIEEYVTYFNEIRLCLHNDTYDSSWQGHASLKNESQFLVSSDLKSTPQYALKNLFYVMKKAVKSMESAACRAYDANLNTCAKIRDSIP